MDSNILGELLAGPGGFAVAIVALLYLGGREYRKGRAEDVTEARAEVERLEKRIASVETEREAVRDQADQARRRLEAKVDEVRAELQADRERDQATIRTLRLRLITDYGVNPEELP